MEVIIFLFALPKIVAHGDLRWNPLKCKQPFWGSTWLL